jgi:hypothetical protein
MPRLFNIKEQVMKYDFLDYGVVVGFAVAYLAIAAQLVAVVQSL